MSVTDPVTIEGIRGELAESLAGLEAEVDRLRGDRAAHGAETARVLTGLEDRLHELALEVGRLENGSSLDQSQALLNEVRNWRQVAANLHLPGAVAACGELARTLTEDRLRRWEDFAAGLRAGGDPDRCFRALVQTTTLDLQCSRHEGRSGGEAEALGRVRADLHHRLLQAVEEHPPGAETRDRWVSTLADRSVGILSDLPDLPPDVAAEQLRIVADDLAWHRDHVETGKGPRRRTLATKAKRLEAEWQERVLQARLEARFGATGVAWSERVLFVLTFVVLALLIVEGSFSLSERTVFSLIMADTAICAAFLVEFFVKLSLAPARGAWFRRHFLIDFLPAIPFGVIGLHAADPVRAGRLARLLRLPRFARYLRVARGLVRVLRVVGFMTRGLDRLARLYAPLLNFNVILYPNRTERQQAHAEGASLTAAVRRLRVRLAERWQHLLVVTEPAAREGIALARLAPLARALERGGDRLPVSFESAPAGSREQIAEVTVRRLSRMSPQEVTLQLGESLTGRLARTVRLFARPPVRWLPIIRACVPRAAGRSTDAEVVAETCRNLGKMLSRWHYRWFWWADLYGTITPTQFVDRLGTVLVQSARRPAYRLTMFAVGLLLANGLIRLLGPSTFLEEHVTKPLWSFFGKPLAILGVVCAVFVALGMWLQRLAQEATDYLQEAATAQFLHLTELIRARYMERDAWAFYERVLGPERRLRSGGAAPGPGEAEAEVRRVIAMTRAWLQGDYARNDSYAAFDPVERTVLLYRDSLDGAVLADSDTRTTSQLLGNPALRRFRTWSRRFDSRDEARLQRLSLTRQKGLFDGPYLWFFLISRAVALQTARLIIDYNRHAVPLEDLDRASPDERERFYQWLDAKEFDPASLPLERREDQYAYVITTAFTALHFLDDDPQRDDEVGERFGPEVLARLRRDRAQLIRLVFGTYPMHTRPKEERVVNLHAAYRSWLGGGRILLLPLFLLGRGLSLVGRALHWFYRCVRDIQTGSTKVDAAGAAHADFPTAVRKIDRMRLPIVEACMRLRAQCDPEYLGVPLPGQSSASLLGGEGPGCGTDFEADCRFVNLSVGFLEEMAAEQQRAEADMHRLSGLIEGGLVQRAAARLGVPAESLGTAEHTRALAVAYLADYLAVRQLLSADAILREVYDGAAARDVLPMRPWPYVRLGLKFKRYCRRHGLRDREFRQAAWRATVHNVGGAAEALDVWHRDAGAGAGGGPTCARARARGEEVVADLLRHPSRITEPLVTLRAVQTLSLLDVLNYREHIYRLGNYAADGDPRDGLGDGQFRNGRPDRPGAAEAADGRPAELPAAGGQALRG